MVTISQAVSVEAFMQLPNDGQRHELVRGEVRSMPPPKGPHGIIELALLAAIDRYLEERAIALGWTRDQGLWRRYHLVGFAGSGEFGMQFVLPDDPHQIRGADGVYVPAEQYAQVAWDHTGYFPAVPWLVCAVISASETAADVVEKIHDYLQGGARRVWCLYPERRAISIHAQDAPTRLVREPEDLTDEELLPGFALPLGLVFP